MTNRFVEGLDSRGVVGVALMVSLSILGCKKDAAGPTDVDAPTPVATTLTLSPTALSFSSFGATELRLRYFRRHDDHQFRGWGGHVCNHINEGRLTNLSFSLMKSACLAGSRF